jgi:hypothetical protein
VVLPPWKTFTSFFLSYHSQQANFPSTFTPYHVLNISKVPRLLISPLVPLALLVPNTSPLLTGGQPLCGFTASKNFLLSSFKNISASTGDLLYRTINYSIQDGHNSIPTLPFLPYPPQDSPDYDAIQGSCLQLLRFPLVTARDVRFEHLQRKPPERSFLQRSLERLRRQPGQRLRQLLPLQRRCCRHAQRAHEQRLRSHPDG